MQAVGLQVEDAFSLGAMVAMMGDACSLGAHACSVLWGPWSQ